MKPFAILVTLALGLASLGIIVWIGQYGGSGLVKKPTATAPEPKPDDLPIPASGPFGKAEVLETEYDFGTRIAGSQDEHTFTIKNVGKGVLQLKLGKPSCQCTIGEITKVAGSETAEGIGGDKVSPGQDVSLKEGESVNIVVKWVMKVFNEHFRQIVPVITTDPDQRQIDLAIKGSIDTPIHLTPGGFWDLGEINRSGISRAEGMAFSNAVESFTLEDIVREKSPVKVTIEPATKEQLEEKNAKCGYRVIVEVPPNIPVGLFKENIRLSAHIDNLTRNELGNLVTTKPANSQEEKKPEDVSKDEVKIDGDKPDSEQAAVASNREEMFLDFTIAGKRSGPIEVRSPSAGIGFNQTSNRVIFGEFPASQGKKGSFLVYVKGMTEDLALLSVEPVDERIKVSLSPGKAIGKSKGYQIEIEILPGPPAKHLAETAAEVNLKLNHPEVPDFKLLIDYNAKP